MSRPFTHVFESIPWEQCARLVQKCEARNRKLMINRVDRLAHAVTEGRFYATHQGVALDPKGNLIDGQHRLAAHARAKTDYIGLVCRYTDQSYADTVMTIFDSGRSRSMADGLVIGGVMTAGDSKTATAICNVLSALMNNGSKPDIQELGDFYREHHASVKWSIKALSSRKCGAYVRGAFALAWELDATKMTELAHQIEAGVGVPGSAAALWNRAHADGLLSTVGGKGDRRAVALRALRILRAHVSGEAPPSKLYTTTDSLEWFLEQIAAKRAAPAPTSVNEAKTEDDDIVRLSSVEQTVFDAIPKDGARLHTLASVLGKSKPQTRHYLSRLEQLGVVRRPETGFYVKVAA